MSLGHQLLTVGYAGHDLDSLLANLKRHGVQVVVDVRQNPVSRKKGFSRSVLCAFLLANGLEYVHESEVGVPKYLRRRLRDGQQDLASYLRDFHAHLNAHDDAVDRLYGLATRKRCCLLCVEQRAEECHRSVVAEAVASRNGHEVRITHI